MTAGQERAGPGLAGQVAVVTGGGRGIGRAIALNLAAAGATVVLGGRDQAALCETGAMIDDTRAGGGRGGWHAFALDVTDEGSVAAFAAETLGRAGVPEAVVCNSGIGGPSGPLWELDRVGWDETFAVNVTGTFLTLRAFLPSMIARGRGAVVLIGSMTGKRPLAGRTPYAAGKLALVGLARTLALEAGPYGIRVNVVSPGFVDGPRLDWVIDAQAGATGATSDEVRAWMLADIPSGRFVAADDVADTVRYLVSPAAAGVTGADVNVTGGLVMY